MNWSEMMQWWNLIFIVPFVLGALIAAMSVFGMNDEDGGDSDDGGDDGVLDDLLDTLHLGGLPPLIVIQNLLLFWGLCGWSANLLLAGSRPGVSALPLSLSIAVVLAFLLTALTSRYMSRFLPSGETAAIKLHQLEGRAGEAAAMITDSAGSAYVRDEKGTLHQITVRVMEGIEPIKQGKKVLIVAYEEDDHVYRVKPWEE